MKRMLAATPEFMAVDPPRGDWLAFVTPLENQVGRVVTILSLIAVALLIVAGIRREPWGRRFRLPTGSPETTREPRT